MIALLSTSDTDLLSARAAGGGYRLGNPARLTADDVLDMGNSGTSTRLLMGLVASHGITASFVGDASQRRVLDTRRRCNACNKHPSHRPQSQLARQRRRAHPQVLFR